MANQTERLINCTAREIRAYQAGGRVLRRRVKQQPQPNKGKGLAPVRPYLTSMAKWTWVLAATGMGDGTTGFYSPFGSPGDRLVLVPRGCRGQYCYEATVRAVRVEQSDGVWWWVAEVEG